MSNKGRCPNCGSRNWSEETKWHWMLELRRYTRPRTVPISTVASRLSKTVLVIAPTAAQSVVGKFPKGPTAPMAHHRGMNSGKTVTPRNESNEDTLRVWQPRYKQLLKAEDALEILINVRNLLDVLYPLE